jgi:hypothetical protein
MLVDVTVSHPAAYQAKREGLPVSPIRLVPPATGGWDKLIQLKFYSPSRTELTLPLHQVSQPDGPLVLDADTDAYTLHWYLGPEETQELSPGTYVGFARLQSTDEVQNGAWTGVSDSLPVTAEVLNEPVSLDEDMIEEKALTFAQYHLYRSDRGAALASLDAQLARQPQSVGALAFKAEMMEDAGELLQAYKLYNAALEAHFTKRPNAQHPPFGLMERRAALSKKLFPETFK